MTDCEHLSQLSAIVQLKYGNRAILIDLLECGTELFTAGKVDLNGRYLDALFRYEDADASWTRGRLAVVELHF